MATITSFKCPNCGSDIPFDPTVGALKCPHCNTEYTQEDILNQSIENSIDTDSFNWEEFSNNTIEPEGRITYICPSCGGAVTGDENISSTFCPYCGSGLIVEEQLSGMLKPEIIIPFKLTKDEAIATYEKYLKNKVFLPSNFKAKNFIEKLNGIYVPYWLFDCTAYAQARFITTKENIYHPDSNTTITETIKYASYREGNAHFDFVPVDASIKLQDGLMDALEPYDYKDAVAFDTSYLSGFLAERYDQDEKESANKANKRIKNSMGDILSKTVTGFNSVSLGNINCQFFNGKVHYALLPVYIFSTKYKGTVYQFAMNGQTGEFAGDLPADTSKVIRYTLLVFIATFVLSFVIIYFILKGGIL